MAIYLPPSLIMLLTISTASILPGMVGYDINLALSVSILVTILMAVKMIQFIKQRRERHKIFDKGNIPSVGNKNIFWGNANEVLDRDDNLEYMLKYHKRLGKNYGIFYGPDPWLLSTDLDLLHKLFVTEADKHINMPNYRTIYPREFNRSLVQMEDDEWRSNRRAFNPTFSHKLMKTDDSLKDIEDSCNKLIDSIRKHKVEVDDQSMKSFIIDLNACFKKFSLEMIVKFAYGFEKGINMEPYSRNETVELARKTQGAASSFLNRFSVMFNGLDDILIFLQKFTKIHYYLGQLHENLDGFTELRRAKIQAVDGQTFDGPKRVIDVIIERAQRGLLDEEASEANVFFFLAAGFETTANTLDWIFWILARHPKVQEKLREAILTEGADATYLDWFLKETLRLYPAVPAGVGRILTEDVTTSQGQTIFKGTSVLASIYSIHRSEEYWGPDVEQFRPERFGEPFKHPLQYFAFGFGPRNCIGMHLAKAEVKAAVTRLLLNFKIEPCASTPNEIKFSSPLLTSVLFKHPINVKFVELSSIQQAR